MIAGAAPSTRDQPAVSCSGRVERGLQTGERLRAHRADRATEEGLGDAQDALQPQVGVVRDAGAAVGGRLEGDVVVGGRLVALAAQDDPAAGLECGDGVRERQRLAAELRLDGVGRPDPAVARRPARRDDPRIPLGRGREVGDVREGLVERPRTPRSPRRSAPRLQRIATGRTDGSAGLQREDPAVASLEVPV